MTIEKYIAIACEPVNWEFECPNRWEDLQGTVDESIRHCESCQQSVYLCTTIDQINRRARLGQCVAWVEQTVDDEGEVETRHFLGEVAATYLTGDFDPDE